MPTDESTVESNKNIYIKINKKKKFQIYNTNFGRKKKFKKYKIKQFFWMKINLNKKSFGVIK
jgi:hypothetical protein